MLYAFTMQNWLILHSKDIHSGNVIDDETQEIINNCHIYMIHTRPLVCFVKDSISYDEKLESKRLRDIISNPLSKKEQVNLIEAGLIRYFQPSYNINLKSNFPSAKQQMLSKLSNIDISGLIIEFYESDSGFKIYSNSIPAKITHFAQYDLTTDENRTSFFNRTIQVASPDEIIKMTPK